MSIDCYGSTDLHSCCRVDYADRTLEITENVAVAVCVDGAVIGTIGLGEATISGAAYVVGVKANLALAAFKFSLLTAGAGVGVGIVAIAVTALAASHFNKSSHA